MSASRKALIGAALSIAFAPVAQAQPAPAGASTIGQGGWSATAPRLPIPTQEQWDASPEVKALVAKATGIAGDDPDLVFDARGFCRPTGGKTNGDRGQYGAPDSEPRLAAIPTPARAVNEPPMRLFDNFYWFGDSGVGSWLITSDDGYILYDALNTEAQAQEVLIGGMRAMGLDPAKIKYLVFGHFHLDHTGGGGLIQRTYHPKVIMGRDDWPLYYRAMASTTGQGARVQGQTPMTQEADAVDGMKLTVGDTTVTLQTMPGHTPGSVGMIVPVKYQGRIHNILLHTAGTDISSRDSFIGGYEKMWARALEARVESVMQVHPNINVNSMARMRYVADNYPPARNPLLYGPEKTARLIEIMRACTQARMAALGW